MLIERSCYYAKLKLRKHKLQVEIDLKEFLKVLKFHLFPIIIYALICFFFKKKSHSELFGTKMSHFIWKKNFL